jgi:O-antigen ligase
LVAFWFIYRLIDSKAMLKWMMVAHSAGCALLGLFAIGAPRDAGRLEGVGGPGINDANTLAMFLATGAIVCLGLMMVEKGWRRCACLLMLAFIGNGFVLANSRGAFLALMLGGAVVMVSKARQHRRAFWGVALVGLIGFAYAVDKAFIERMFTIGDVTEQSEDADMSARSRVVIYEAQAKMFLDHPLGAGYRGTVVLSPGYLDRKWLTLDRPGDESTAGRASHNTFMTTLVEQGLPGALIYGSLTFWLLSRVLTIRRLDKRGADPELTTLGSAVCGGLVAVFVAGLAADYLMAEVQFWLFAAFVSLLQLSRESALARENTSVVPQTQPGALLRREPTVTA